MFRASTDNKFQALIISVSLCRPALFFIRIRFMNEIIVVEINQGSGFMKDFELVSVITDNQQLPLSGPGVAYYRKGNEQYSLRTSWKNGKKEGKGLLYNSHNQVCAQLNFEDDMINGECVIRDNKGIARFRGQLVNGEKEGYCEEFDGSGIRVFSGYYEGGTKQRLIESVNGAEGLLAEYSRRGDLLTISEYDSYCITKNGLCFEFENNELVRCVMMEMGEAKYICREYKIGMMKCFDEQGRITYEGEYSKNPASRFCREGNGKEFNALGQVVYEGLFSQDERMWNLNHTVENNRHWILVTLKSNLQKVMKYELKENRVREGKCLYYEDNEIVRVTEWVNGEEVRTVAEFNGNIMREYTPEGKLCYEGNHSKKESTWCDREGEGTEYLSDGITTSYIGSFLKNKREGQGIWYSDGLPTYTGLWAAGIPNGQGVLMNELGSVMCEGVWECGYLLTTKGWIDYETKQLYTMNDKRYLPKWINRGGRKHLSSIELSYLKFSAMFLSWYRNLFMLTKLILFSISSLVCLIIAGIASYYMGLSSGWGWSCLIFYLFFIIFLIVAIIDKCTPTHYPFYFRFTGPITLSKMPSCHYPLLPYFSLLVSLSVASLAFLNRSIEINFNVFLANVLWLCYICALVIVIGILHEERDLRAISVCNNVSMFMCLFPSSFLPALSIIPCWWNPNASFANVGIVIGCVLIVTSIVDYFMYTSIFVCYPYVVFFFFLRVFVTTFTQALIWLVIFAMMILLTLVLCLPSEEYTQNILDSIKKKKEVIKLDQEGNISPDPVGIILCSPVNQPTQPLMLKGPSSI